MSNPKASNSCS